MGDCTRFLKYDPSQEPSSILFSDHNCYGNSANFPSSISGKTIDLFNYPGDLAGNEISYYCAPHHTCIFSNQNGDSQRLLLSQMGMQAPKYSRRIEKGGATVNDEKLRSMELGCCGSAPNYDPGWHSIDTVEIQLRKSWDQFKVDCCMGKEDPRICSSMIPQSDYCDNIMHTYCQAHPTDPVCACFSPNAIAPAACFYAPCTTGGYKTQNDEYNAQHCPSRIDCNQYINLSKTSPGVMTAQFQNVALSQNCTINQQGQPQQQVVHDTNTGNTSVTLPSNYSGNVRFTPPASTGIGYGSSYGSGSGYGSSSSSPGPSKLMIIILMIVFVSVILFVVLLLFSDDEEEQYRG